MKPPLRKIYNRLYAAFGPRHWWPGDTPFEVMVGAVLTQNTAWTNVEKAIENLKREQVLKPRAILSLSSSRLARLLKPAGYFRVKTRRLKSYVRYYVDRHGANPRKMAAVPLDRLRAELLGVHGIGPETADSILLYALGKPVFVVDAYTHRIFQRHGWLRAGRERSVLPTPAATEGRITWHGLRAGGERSVPPTTATRDGRIKKHGSPPKTSYDELQNLFMNNLKSDAALYNEFHALIVNVGKDYCKSRPRCESCPLAPLLPGRKFDTLPSKGDS